MVIIHPMFHYYCGVVSSARTWLVGWVCPACCWRRRGRRGRRRGPRARRTSGGTASGRRASCTRPARTAARPRCTAPARARCWRRWAATWSESPSRTPPCSRKSPFNAFRFISAVCRRACPPVCSSVRHVLVCPAVCPAICPSVRLCVVSLSAGIGWIFANLSEGRQRTNRLDFGSSGVSRHGSCGCHLINKQCIIYRPFYSDQNMPTIS